MELSIGACYILTRLTEKGQNVTSCSFLDAMQRSDMDCHAELERRGEACSEV